MHATQPSVATLVKSHVLIMIVVRITVVPISIALHGIPVQEWISVMYFSVVMEQLAIHVLQVIASHVNRIDYS